MSVKETAVAYHAGGYNCCQSVLCALKEYTGLTEETSAALGYGFGGGMFCGNVCGAVTGGLMAIGKACLGVENVAEEKRRMESLAKSLEADFEAEIGTLLCREIVEAHGKTYCDHCIAFSAETAEKLILKENTTKTEGE